MSCRIPGKAVQRAMLLSLASAFAFAMNAAKADHPDWNQFLHDQDSLQTIEPAETIGLIHWNSLLESEAEGATSIDAAGNDKPTSSQHDFEALLKRVDELEKSVKAEAEKVAEAEAKKAKDSSWDLGGRVHLDNWYFPDSDAGTNFLENGDPGHDPEDRWDFRRIRLELQGRVPDNMRFRFQVDFNNPSAPEIKDVYLGWDGLPNNHMLLLGTQKRPIGMDHLNSSRHNVFMERPLAVEAFNQDSRRLGACMYGYSDDEVFNWQYGVFLLENIADDGRYRGDLQESGLYGRLAASPWYDETSGGRGYFHCAIAGSVNRTDGDGSSDEDENENEARFRTRPMARSDSRWWDTGTILGAEGYQQLAYEALANMGSLQITSEYLGNWVQRDPLGGFAGDDMVFHGGYVFVNYFLTGEYIPLDRTSGQINRVKPIENFFLVDRCRGGCGSGWGALSIGLRYDYLDLVDSDIQGGRGHGYTVASNWYWTAYSKLQTDLGWGQIEDAGQGRSNVPLFAGVSGEFTTLGMRYMIDF